MKPQIPIQDTDHRQLQDAVLEEWQERAAQLHPGDARDRALDSAREVALGQNVPPPERDGRKTAPEKDEP